VPALVSKKNISPGKVFRPSNFSNIKRTEISLLDKKKKGSSTSRNASGSKLKGMVGKKFVKPDQNFAKTSTLNFGNQKKSI
jgi:hypothetical protein